MMRFVYSLLFFSCVYAVYRAHIQIRPSDRTAYQEIVDTPRLMQKHSLARHPITQTRTNIRKELWIPQKNLHLSLTSDHSQLFLLEQEGGIDLQERLHHVRCTDGTHTLSAQNSFYSYRSRQIDFHGDVYVFSQGRFLYAPHCTYSFDSQKALLESDLGSNTRVLLWEKENARSVSARKLEIHLDRSNPFEEVKAFGDVHCTFDLEEKNLIERFLEH